MGNNRPPIPQAIQDALFVECRRKCAMCYALLSDWHPKNGQIAHIDRNNANNKPENLAYLCLDHHNEYDGTPGLTKRFTPGELKSYRAMLLKAILEREAQPSPQAHQVSTATLELKTKVAVVWRSNFVAAGALLYVAGRLSNAGSEATAIKEARFFWGSETIADYSWGIPIRITTNGQPAVPDDGNFTRGAQYLTCDSSEIFEPGRVYPIVVPLAVRKDSPLMDVIRPVLEGKESEQPLPVPGILELVPVKGAPFSGTVSVLQARRR